MEAVVSASVVVSKSNIAKCGNSRSSKSNVVDGNKSNKNGCGVVASSPEAATPTIVDTIEGMGRGVMGGVATGGRISVISFETIVPSQPETTASSPAVAATHKFKVSVSAAGSPVSVATTTPTVVSVTEGAGRGVVGGLTTGGGFGTISVEPRGPSLSPQTTAAAARSCKAVPVANSPISVEAAPTVTSTVVNVTEGMGGGVAGGLATGG